jgi:hypothetical protein
VAPEAPPQAPPSTGGFASRLPAFKAPSLEALKRPEAPLALLLLFFVGDIIIVASSPSTLLVPAIYGRGQYLYGILSILLVLGAASFTLTATLQDPALLPWLGPLVHISPTRLTFRLNAGLASGGLVLACAALVSHLGRTYSVLLFVGLATPAALAFCIGYCTWQQQNYDLFVPATATQPKTANKASSKAADAHDLEAGSIDGSASAGANGGPSPGKGGPGAVKDDGKKPPNRQTSIETTTAIAAAQLAEGYRRGSDYWKAANGVVKWWGVAGLLLLVLALSMPPSLDRGRAWIGWTLPMWMVILAVAAVANRKWFNTFEFGRLIVSLIAAQSALIVLWGLLMWRVALHGAISYASLVVLFIVFMFPALEAGYTGLHLWSDNKQTFTPVSKALLGAAFALFLAFGVFMAALLSVAAGVMVIMALCGFAGE